MLAVMRHPTLALMIVLAACKGGGASPPTTTTTPTAGSDTAPPTGIVITDAGIGPIQADTPATLDGLRGKLVGFEVKAVRDERDNLQYDAYKDGVLVLSVIEDGGRVVTVLTTDPKVSVATHPTWHAGGLFSDAKLLSRCDCWGGKMVCWKDGEHVALAFERSCQKPVDDARALVVLDGTSIQKLVWSPQALGALSTTPVAPTGGGLGGTVKPKQDDDE